MILVFWSGNAKVSEVEDSSNESLLGLFWNGGLLDRSAALLLDPGGEI